MVPALPQNNVPGLIIRNLLLPFTIIKLINQVPKATKYGASNYRLRRRPAARACPMAAVDRESTLNYK